MENVKHIILRNVKIIDSNSKYNGDKKELLIIDGIIEKIDKKIKIDEPFFEIESEDMHISPGWLDLHARMVEPGFEYR